MMPSFSRIRSFVRRDSRMTEAQQQAWQNLSHTLCLNPSAGFLDFTMVFGRDADCMLEIGFGSGQSLSAVAEQHPEYHFIGIETFKPGIGALLQQVQQKALSNIRIYYADAVNVLEKCIPDQSLKGMQIFFPDPWPKRRHHKRRLIQTPFVQLATLKLKPGGFFHLATDWQDYALQMMRVLSSEACLRNLMGQAEFAKRSSFRPITTKFEEQGEKEGRPIWELQFEKI